ncbi:MAG: NEW3 domain-containing protein [Promethearchaeota archaeon]
MGSEDFMLELFERLDKLPMNQAVAEALQLLEKIRTEGSPEEAKKAAKRAVDLLWQNSERMRDSKSLKHAASQLATAYTIASEVLNDKEMAKKSILQAAEYLIQAANEYLIWEDVDSGTGMLATASLLKFLADDFDLSLIESKKPKINFGRSILGAEQMIEIPSLLVQSINKVDPNMLNNAKQRCLSLLPRIKDAAEFMKLINKSLMHVERRLSESIAFPSIKSVFETPKDLVLGQKFMAKFKLRNNGEGVAQDVSYSINIPRELRVSGSTTESIPEMKPGAETEKTLELTIPKDETFADQEFKVHISVSFKDIVGNMQTQTLGPFSLVVGKVSKAEESQKAINAHKDALSALKERITEIALPTVFQAFIDGMTDLASNILNKCITSRENEEYELIPILLDVFEELVSKTKDTMPNAVADYESERKQFEELKEALNSLTKKVNDLGQLANKIQDIAQLMNETELNEEGKLLIQRAIQELNDASKSLTEAVTQVKELTEEKS